MPRARATAAPGSPFGPRAVSEPAEPRVHDARMSRHTVATLVAAALTVVGVIAVTVLPMPYVRYQPGTTVDLLSEDHGK